MFFVVLDLLRFGALIKKIGLTIKLVKANVLPGEKKGLINSHELDFDF